MMPFDDAGQHRRHSSSSSMVTCALVRQFGAERDNVAHAARQDVGNGGDRAVVQRQHAQPPAHRVGVLHARHLVADVGDEH
jgi:hypothetical protein